jgi:RNAse (barnase) inhibitor barstar
VTDRNALLVYEIPGERITSLEAFYRVIGEAINGPGGYFGTNLDALADCLRGGFGTPEGGYVIRWLNADASRRELGYAETVRQLEARLARCHISARDQVRQDLARACRHEGPTAFDWLVEILNSTEGVTLELC